MTRLRRRRHDLARSGAWRGRQARGDDLAVGVRIDGRMEKLIERSGIDSCHRIAAADQAFVASSTAIERRLAVRLPARSCNIH